MTDSLRAQEVATDAASAALGEPAAWLGGWLDAPLLPALRGARSVRLVYALPAPRLASLLPWRDSIERWVEDPELGTLHVVAHDAAIWARLVLKRHGPTHATLARTPFETPAGALDGLRRWACPRVIHAACDEAGWPLPDAPAPEPPTGDRRDALDRWLFEIRPSSIPE